MKKARRTNNVAGEEAQEGIAPFNFCSAGHFDDRTESHDSHNIVFIGPRPKEVAHCPVSFPPTPSEKFHRRNRDHNRSLESMRHRTYNQSGEGRKRSACSPLRWVSCEHLFYQEYLWDNRFKFVQGNGEPHALVLLVMKRLSDLMHESVICLVLLYLGNENSYRPFYQEGLPTELVHRFLTFLVKEGRLNSTSFLSCLSSRALQVLDFSDMLAIQPPNPISPVPAPISEDAYLNIPIYLSHCLTTLDFGDVSIHVMLFNYHLPILSLSLSLFSLSLLSLRALQSG